MVRWDLPSTKRTARRARGGVLALSELLPDAIPSLLAVASDAVLQAKHSSGAVWQGRVPRELKHMLSSAVECCCLACDRRLFVQGHGFVPCAELVWFGAAGHRAIQAWMRPACFRAWSARGDVDASECWYVERNQHPTWG